MPEHHPLLSELKQAFPDTRLLVTHFRGDTTVVAPKEVIHDVLAKLRELGCDFLSDVVGVDYLDYPESTDANAPQGRFGVVWNILGTGQSGQPPQPRLRVKVLLEPSLPTDGIEDDPALHIPSSCDLWAGAEWLEREIFDMFGIRFDGHPDLRRILLWKDYPAHPLRKEYPVKGQGERELYEVIQRDSA